MAKVDLVNMSKGQATKLATSMASCSELVSLRPLKAAWREAAAMTDLGARMKAYSVAAKVAMVVACLVRVASRWEGKEERQEPGLVLESSGSKENCLQQRQRRVGADQDWLVYQQRRVECG